MKLRRRPPVVTALARPVFDRGAHGLPSPNVDRNAFIRECRHRMRDALVDYAAAEVHINRYARYFTQRYGHSLIADIELGNDADAAMYFNMRNNARERVRTYAAMIYAEEELSYLDAGRRDNGDEPTVVTPKTDLHGLVPVVPRYRSDGPYGG